MKFSTWLHLTWAIALGIVASKALWIVIHFIAMLLTMGIGSSRMPGI